MESYARHVSYTGRNSRNLRPDPAARVLDKLGLTILNRARCPPPNPPLTRTPPDPRIQIEEAARALCEAMEDDDDLADVLAVLENPGKPISMTEIREKYSL